MKNSNILKNSSKSNDNLQPVNVRATLAKTAGVSEDTYSKGKTSEDLASEVDSFPDIRYFTGNYYVVYESYGFTYRDKNYRPYHIKDGQYRNVSYKGNERKEVYLPLDSDEITRYYKIFIQIGLTGTENGQEEDYMSLDVVAETASPDDKFEFEVLSHGVM